MNLDILIIIKLVSLFLGTLFSLINIGNFIRGARIGFKYIVLQTIGLLGFVIIQFKLYL